MHSQSHCIVIQWGWGYSVFGQEFAPPVALHCNASTPVFQLSCGQFITMWKSLLLPQHYTALKSTASFFPPSRVNANLLFGKSLHPLEHCTVVYGLPLFPAAVTAVSKHFRIVLFRSLSLNRMGALGFFTAALLWHQSGGTL